MVAVELRGRHDRRASVEAVEPHLLSPIKSYAGLPEGHDTGLVRRQRDDEDRFSCSLQDRTGNAPEKSPSQPSFSVGPEDNHITGLRIRYVQDFFHGIGCRDDDVVSFRQACVKRSPMMR